MRDTNVPLFIEISPQKLLFKTLKSNARMKRKWNKGLSEHRFKIEVSIEKFGLYAKYYVRKNKGGGKQWVLRKCYSFAAVGLQKIFWLTGMADSAID